MKKEVLYALIIGFVLINSSAFAGLISVTPGAGWQIWTVAADLNEDNNPYWDVDSWDGRIGWVAVGPW